MNNFQLRVIGGFFVFLVGIIVAIGSPYLSYLFFILAAAWGIYELNCIFKRPLDFVLIGLSIFFVAVNYLYFSIALIGILGVLYYRKPFLLFYAAIIMIACKLSIYTRHMNDFLLINIFMLSWCHDMGGYFLGKLLKGPKILPSISPNKTWSGLGGGILLGSIWWFLSFGFFPLWTIVVANFLGLLGDLLESTVKRLNNVKDSGDLIPGSGGLLDRLDAFFFITIFYYILFKFHFLGS